MKISRLVRLFTIVLILLSIISATFCLAVLQTNQGIGGSILLIMSIICALLSAVVATAGFTSVERSVKHPLAGLSQTVAELANGSLNINPDPSLLAQEDSSELAVNIYKLAAMFKNINRDLSAAASELNGKGNLDYRLDESAYNGSYKDLIGGTNTLIENFASDKQEFMNSVKEISNGNLDFIGGNPATIKNIAELSIGLKEINSEILALIQSAITGNTLFKADANRHLGDWRTLLQKLNFFVYDVAEKINWYESILDAIPFPLSVTDNEMNWTFINKATEDFIGKSRKDIAGQPCHNWGAAICRTANCGINCLNRGTSRTVFNQGGMDFQVDVSYIKNLRGEKIGHVEACQDITKLNGAVRQMNKIVQNIMAASKQVSQSSQNIAAGAIEQAGQAERLIGMFK